MKEALEDDFRWVLRKAMKGRGMAPSEVAERAGVPKEEMLASSRGRFSAELARKVAPVLGWNPEALATLPGYCPQVSLPPGLVRHAVPFDDGFVNAWLLRGEDAAVLVDAGPGPAALLRFLEDDGAAFARGLEVFVTHPHGDHIGGLPALRGIFHRLHAPENARLPGRIACRPGEVLETPPFCVRILDLDGHWPGAVGFFIEGLETPVCAVGDALFAGSVGGTPDTGRHRIALERIRGEILSLPAATILLPGHGPPTTVALERRHNPFFP